MLDILDKFSKYTNIRKKERERQLKGMLLKNGKKENDDVDQMVKSYK